MALVRQVCERKQNVDAMGFFAIQSILQSPGHGLAWCRYCVGFVYHSRFPLQEVSEGFLLQFSLFKG